CRPGDVLSPEMDKVKTDTAGVAQSEEEQLICALFPQSGRQYVEKHRNGAT
ncbi:MAG: hypothetical protein KKB20_27905, partial [Proteobacteria bacterium]|nr:hypothetical protein [Pseudomonadota bacterium]